MPYNVTDRKGYYDTKHRYDINPYAYFEATGGGQITVTDEAGNPDLSAFDPIELLYDYITYGTLSRSQHRFTLRRRTLLATLQWRF